LEERGARITGRGEFPRGVDDSRDQVTDDRLVQRVLGREVPTDRPCPDAGPPRDLRHGDRQALRRKSVSCHLEDALTIALRVSTHEDLPTPTRGTRVPIVGRSRWRSPSSRYSPIDERVQKLRRRATFSAAANDRGSCAPHQPGGIGPGHRSLWVVPAAEDLHDGPLVSIPRPW